ncbi:MAG: outer membrane protein assembly factor BamD [Bacteroidetes bacterium SW_7_64_58]|jgi:outer membrane protein assembly factor BamD|nr:MAG: outer membrane protein assembly factor BamD [Bacteroidetes bacterium QH_6_64_77]PSQ89984.1 MAG: outer membrane protein assembly factor BamD [Bacteroidetes bacterium QS_4_64_154]PSR00497.1 MAG: outer membrane protein assembly factor BamD [Bacteroidetes bacterium SW_7_64_58]
MRFSVLVPVLLFAFFGAFVGCSGSGQITYEGPEDAYKKGMTQMEEEDYQQAIRLFRAVFEYGRGNEWAPKARFKLAMAQRKLGKHLVAANEFKRFTQLYRNNELIPRAEFERANSYYLRSPMYRLDQSDSREAISLFRLFVDRHPNHELVPEAKEKVNELRAKLARKKYAAGQLYERREMWKAATTVYEGAFDQYPDTPWADDALLGAVRTYIRFADRSVQEKRADRYQKAIENYNRLTQLFPESDLLNKAESLYSEARRKLDRVQARDGEQSLAQEDTSRGSN